MKPSLLPCAFLAIATFACGGAETQNTAVLAPTPTQTAAPAPSAPPTDTGATETPATPPPNASSTSAAGFCPTQGRIHFGGGDGSSMKDAVVILGAKGEGDGVASEYTCLAAVYGPRNATWTLTSQSLLSDGGKSYDLMDVQLKSGKTTKVFFDITDYFGKF